MSNLYLHNNRYIGKEKEIDCSRNIPSRWGCPMLGCGSPGRREGDTKRARGMVVSSRALGLRWEVSSLPPGGRQSLL